MYRFNFSWQIKNCKLKDLNNFMLRNKNANCYIDAINDNIKKIFQYVKKK